MSARNQRNASAPSSRPAVETAFGCASRLWLITIVTVPSAFGTAAPMLTDVRASRRDSVAMKAFHTTRFQNRQAGGRWVTTSA